MYMYISLDVFFTVATGVWIISRAVRAVTLNAQRKRESDHVQVQVTVVIVCTAGRAGGIHLFSFLHGIPCTTVFTRRLSLGSNFRT